MNTTSKNPRVALVTGSGGRRIGRSVALTFAAAGYDIAAHANSNADEGNRLVSDLRGTGRSAELFVADLTTSHSVDDLASSVLNRFGRLDVLVNNAAIWRKTPFSQLSELDLLDHFRLNTMAVALCCQNFGMKMSGQDSGGAIINVGDWAIGRPYCEYGAYLISKGAIPTLTRVFAAELAQKNSRVRVNAILPGPVMFAEHTPRAERDTALSRTLLRREGNARNVADAALALAQNDFVTGVCLPVDGGCTIA